MDQLNKVKQHWSKLPKLKSVVIIDTQGFQAEDNVVTWEEFIAFSEGLVKYHELNLNRK